MRAMERVKADIAIIGGGAAGLRACIAAAEKNPKLKIALVSKVYPVRSHTVSAEGGIAGVLSFDLRSFSLNRFCCAASRRFVFRVMILPTSNY